MACSRIRAGITGYLLVDGLIIDLATSIVWGLLTGMLESTAAQRASPVVLCRASLCFTSFARDTCGGPTPSSQEYEYSHIPSRPSYLICHSRITCAEETGPVVFSVAAMVHTGGLCAQKRRGCRRPAVF